MAKYQGIELEDEEVKILEEFEKMVGEKIPQIEEIGLTAFGFKAEEGKITGLGFAKKGLIELPTSIGGLTSLKNLNLQMNKLEELPEQFSELTKLEELDLWNNKLIKLPESIGKLSKLKDIDLKSNSLEELPEGLFELKNLEKLDLWGNKIETISAKIGGLTNLKYLILYNNLLKTIPEEMADLENFVEVNLTGNNLESVPKRACTKICEIREWKWKNLKEEDLKVIQEISILIGVKIPKVKKVKDDTLGYKEKKGKIEALGLVNSWLKILPESIEDLTKLQHLNLSSNSFSALPKVIEKLSNLKTLDLTKNYMLEKLPEITIQKFEDQGCKIIID